MQLSVDTSPPAGPAQPWTRPPKPAARTGAENQALVEENLRHCDAVAEKLSRQFAAMEYDDVFQEAAKCLTEIVGRFDPHRGSLRGLIRSHLLQDTHRAMARITGVVRVPRGAEGAVRQPTALNGEAVLVPDRSRSKRERQSELRVALESFLEDLDNNEQQVLRRLFGIGRDPETLEQVASSLDVHHTTVLRMRDRALENIRKAGAKKALKDFYGPEAR